MLRQAQHERAIFSVQCTNVLWSMEFFLYRAHPAMITTVAGTRCCVIAKFITRDDNLMSALLSVKPLRRIRLLCLQLLCILVLANAAHAQNLPIYSDSLLNGWQNWSWATVNFNTQTPVHSGSASASVAADGYEAIYLHHDAFDTSLYSTLTFWLHGGASGGQQLQVQALLNGAAQTAVVLPSLPANTWQQFSISLTALGVANKPNMDGFWLQSRTSQTQPTFYVDDVSLVAVSAPTAVNINVNAANVIRTVDARHFGVNAVIWDQVFDTAATINLLNEIGNRTLRFPGGSLSDEYHWATNTTLNNNWQWATSFDKFAHVATTTQAHVFITVNYGTGTPTEAADWVRYANITKGLGFKYWEVGNENYGAWEADSTSRPHDPYTYAQRFRDYFTQMKAVDPTIKIGAVVITGEDSYANYSDHPTVNPRTGQQHNGWTPVMLATLRSLGITPDFVVYHRYPQAPGAENDAVLLQSSSSWVTDAADLRQQLNDYLGSAAESVELICTENNSVYTTPGKQSTSLVNGLFFADSLTALLHTEFNGLIWWDLRNSQDTGNNNSSTLYGWRMYGDYGIVNSANPPGPADRYPTFYVTKLLQFFARGGDQLISATSDYPLLTAHAVKKATGSLALLVINKSATAALNANVAVTGLVPGNSGTIYFYGIPQDEAARTGVGSADIAATPFSGLQTNFTYTFPAYSVSVLAFGNDAPPPPVIRRPDSLIKNNGESAYVGDSIYNSDGANQTRAQTVRAGRSATFFIMLQNDGSVSDSFTVQGTGSATGYSIKYYTGTSGGTDITNAVTTGAHQISNLAPGGSQVIRAVITSARNLASGTTKDFLITTSAIADTTKRDSVKATVRIN